MMTGYIFQQVARVARAVLRHFGFEFLRQQTTKIYQECSKYLFSAISMKITL